MVIAVDFDGTIVTNEFPNIGKEIPFATDVLRKILSEGKYKLILWTSREGERQREAVEWCNQRGIYFYAVNIYSFILTMEWRLWISNGFRSRPRRISLFDSAVG